MRVRHWLFLDGCLWFVCLFCLVACSAQTDTMEAIQRRGALYIGLDPSYPPFAALAPDGVLYGLDVDLGRALTQRLFPERKGDVGGVKAHFVFLGYDGLYHALEVGEVDILISALVIDPGRMDKVAYSDSYFDAGLVLIVQLKDKDEIREVRDLVGRSVAVEYATEAEVEARRWSRRLGDLAIQPVLTAEDALTLVLSGAAQAALVDGISARLFLREHPGLFLVPEPVSSEACAVALRIEDRALLRAVNAALEDLAADGELEEILDRWF